MIDTIYFLAFLATSCLLLQHVHLAASMTVTVPKKRATTDGIYVQASLNIKVNGDDTAVPDNKSCPACNSQCNSLDMHDIVRRLTAIEESLINIGNTLNRTDTETERPPPSKIYSSCKEALADGVTTSGVYTVDPKDGQGPFKVFCDMVTDGGGWAVFQRRKDGSVDFFRGWKDYKNGFGDLTGEFWLGLDKIHRLARVPRLLRVDMTAFDGKSAYASFKSFKVGDETQQYILNIRGYSGSAGDSLSLHNGQKFYTKDKDHVRSKCANTYKGAWWYESCHHSNLNGLYHKGAHESHADGVNWRHWKGYNESLKFTEMKVRPY